MARQVEIVLIEDNKYEAELTIRSLKLQLPDYQYVHLHDGKQALDFLFAEGVYAYRINLPLPALILLDLDLPKVHGVEVLRKIKSHAKTRSIPVVVLSKTNGEPGKQQCYDHGANSFIVKPVDFPKFVESVTEVGKYWLIRNEPPS